MQSTARRQGLTPENTVAAMLNAIDLGVPTLEMDTSITADGKVTVAHDVYLPPFHPLTGKRKEIPLAVAQKYSIFQMMSATLRQFDVGSKPYPAFPNQKKCSRMCLF